LHFDPRGATKSEATVFGGMKTKDIDVTVLHPLLGPCFAVSMKGVLNAFRNLTNRLEEAVGDCTNLHVAYPALVYGFLNLIRANRAGPVPKNGERFLVANAAGEIDAPDIAIYADGAATPFITSYFAAMTRLSGRTDLRQDPSRYEAIAICMISGEDRDVGSLLPEHPPDASALRFEEFFPRLYTQYDMRFVYGAPNLRRHTARYEWHPESPALKDPRVSLLDYEPRRAARDVSVDDDRFAGLFGDPNDESD
jgi:hypothetical protein